MSEAQPVIEMEQVRKIFYTDGVETHALAGIDHEGALNGSRAGREGARGHRTPSRSCSRRPRD